MWPYMETHPQKYMDSFRQQQQKTDRVLKKENIPNIDQYWTFYLCVLLRGANIHKLATLSYFWPLTDIRSSHHMVSYSLDGSYTDELRFIP